MARLRVSLQMVEDLIFGFSPHPVSIKSLAMDQRGGVVFEIAGEDVPETAEVEGLLTLRTNRAGQRLFTQEFRPLDGAPAEPRALN